MADLESAIQLPDAAVQRRASGGATVNQAVVDLALAVGAINALPALVGGWLWRRCQNSQVFWVLLRAGQAAAVVLAAVTGVLAAAGDTSTDGLFYLYALLPLAVGFVAEQLRVVAAQTILDRHGLEKAADVGGLPPDGQRLIVVEILRREMGVMALSALVVVFLAARAAGTAHGL